MTSGYVARAIVDAALEEERGALPNGCSIGTIEPMPGFPMANWTAEAIAKGGSLASPMAAIARVQSRYPMIDPSELVDPD